METWNEEGQALHGSQASDDLDLLSTKGRRGELEETQDRGPSSPEDYGADYPTFQPAIGPAQRARGRLQPGQGDQYGARDGCHCPSVGASGEFRRVVYEQSHHGAAR